MKTHDVSRQVMDSVVRFENIRTRRWWTLFIAVIFVLLGSAGIAVYIAGTSLFEEEIRNLVALYFEDFDMIKNLWQDALEFIWAIVPKELIYFAVCIIIFVGILIILTRSKRRLNAKRLQSIARYTDRTRRK